MRPMHAPCRWQCFVEVQRWHGMIPWLPVPRLATTLIATTKPQPPSNTQPVVVTASVADAFDTKLNERLKEQRDALETDRDKAVLAANSAAFEEKQKLVDQVEQLKRSLEKKTAEDLGKGGEVQLEKVQATW